MKDLGSLAALQKRSESIMMTAAPGPQIIDGSSVNEAIPTLTGEKAESYDDEQLVI